MGFTCLNPADFPKLATDLPRKADFEAQSQVHNKRIQHR
jgi:hypothetical protein